MPKTPDRRLGTIAWVDLTVPDAPQLREFYAAVTGWVPEALSMGDYDDYVMNAPVSGTATAGVCHSRGANADLPQHWIVYIIVDDLDKRLAECRARGGDVIAGPKSMGGTARYAVIRDPAGAVAALYAGALPSVPESKPKKKPAKPSAKKRSSSAGKSRRKTGRQPTAASTRKRPRPATRAVKKRRSRAR
jgi:uncharacterized protein